ncbi:MAG: hypothetical protein AAB222_00520 [Candidatus Binatota bacterium]
MSFGLFSSSLKHSLLSRPDVNPSNLKLDNGSRVAVIGGGPAGSFFSYFLLDMAQRVDIDVQVDIYEPRDFSHAAPQGCNMCGGIISESLVQLLAVEGINLPAAVVQRGIDSYMLHMSVGSVRIGTPLHEKRIAAVHRGAGPRDIKEVKWKSLDGYLQWLASDKGAHLVCDRVDHFNWKDGRPQIKTRGGLVQEYDLLAVAVGVNSGLLKIFRDSVSGYEPPRVTKTYICEYHLGQETIEKYMGSSMHVFLLSIPRLEFAAIIPKGDYVTVCLLGDDIDGPLIKSFLESPEVRRCFPPDLPLDPPSCRCSPHINVTGATQPFADRIVFIGDSGVTRLYKDGIGAAYRTAKAAASTAILQGISAENFRQYYWPACKRIAIDNRIGKIIFAYTGVMQKLRHDLRGILRMVSKEQMKDGCNPRMSMALWDLFTGSAPYREILLRMLNPVFVGRFIWNVVVGSLPIKRGRRP